MYSAEATHEAIICQEMFDAVQTEMACRSEKSKKTGRSKQTYPFTGKMVCRVCGKNYMRKPTPTGPVWICSTFNLQGKAFCASKQIPEETLFKVTAEVLGDADFDKQRFEERVVSIQICADNTLVYRFKDGTEIEKQWKDRPRSHSWTEEMRADARQRAIERSRNQCQK